jgi:pantoate--beta-alanine ligase
MLITEEIGALRAFLEDCRQKGQRIGFVPTMGALHDGHVSLVQKAKSRCDVVVCSIFVNPTQFNESADFDRYPRDIETDAKKLEPAGCNAVFAPAVDFIYPSDHVAKTIEMGSLAEVMEGVFRPGHFKGVVEVVARLFDIVEPDAACFGEKDFQQLAVIRQLVAQHEYPIEIIPCAIIREENGLAMSSRNALLTADQRAQAAILHETLMEMKERSQYLNPDEVEDFGAEALKSKSFLELEYMKVANSATLLPMFRWHECDSARAFVVARFGEVRLIDNMEIWSR